MSLILILLEDNFRFVHERITRSLVITKNIVFNFLWKFSEKKISPPFLFLSNLLHYFVYLDISFCNQCYNPIIKFELVFLINVEAHILANFFVCSYVDRKKKHLLLYKNSIKVLFRKGFRNLLNQTDNILALQPSNIIELH